MSRAARRLARRDIVKRRQADALRRMLDDAGFDKTLAEAQADAHLQNLLNSGYSRVLRRYHPPKKGRAP